jgi:hypothetical protein
MKAGFASTREAVYVWLSVVLSIIGILLWMIFIIIRITNDTSIMNSVSASTIGSRLGISRQFSVSDNATKISEDMYYLGERQHRRYGKIKGFTTVREKRNKHKSSVQNALLNETTNSLPIRNVTSFTTDPCSTVLYAGAKWKRSATYVLDTTNDQGLTDSFVVSTVNYSMSQWNVLLSDFKVFGMRDTHHTARGADLNNPDGFNMILFAHVGSDTVIAYTTVWGIFDGPIGERQIIEADVVLNEDFRWGDAALQGPSVMDCENEETHEFGHFCGMGHSKNKPECQDDTMWPTSSYGETKKRTLTINDETGFCNLYSEHTCTIPGFTTGGSSDPPTPSTSSSDTLTFSSNLELFILLIFAIVYHFM